MLAEYLLIFLAAYLIGSIPFGLLLTKAAGLGDIRAIGSGNIGATNVLRTGRKGLALATLLLDGFKGYGVVYYVAYLYLPRADMFDFRIFDPLVATATVGVVVGHVFPIWLKFRGGKGVATALGAWLGFGLPGFVACGLWLLTALISRRSSLASLVAVAGAPLALTLAILYDGGALSMKDWDVYKHLIIFIVPHYLLALLIIYRHKANIQRLLAGTEPKIGQK